MGLGSCEHRPHFPPRANVETYPLFRDLGHWERPWCLRKLVGVAGGGGSGRWGGVGWGASQGHGRRAGSSAWRWGSASSRQASPTRGRAAPPSAVPAPGPPGTAGRGHLGLMGGSVDMPAPGVCCAVSPWRSTGGSLRAWPRAALSPGDTDRFGSPALSVFRGRLLGPAGPGAGLSPSRGARGPSSPSTADAGPAAVPPRAVSVCPVGEPRARCPDYGGFRSPPTPGPTGGIPSLGQQARENRAPWSHFNLLRAEP